MRLVILSPHRDDAVFSLALTLNCWRKRIASFTVVNFFTESAYAPRAILRDPTQDRRAAVSLQRYLEDKRALLSTCGPLQIQSAGLIDAPLRLGIPASAVCNFWEVRVRSEDVSAVAQHIGADRSRLFFSPLALGDHIDHHTVRRAAMEAVPPSRLGFYEDLPYATWTSESDILARVSDTESSTGVKLRPVVIRSASARVPKRRLAGMYGTQITRSEAALIAGYSSKYGSGERIWVPRNRSPWNLVARPQGQDQG